MSNPIILPARLVVGECEIDIEVGVYVTKSDGTVTVEGVEVNGGDGRLSLEQDELDRLADELSSLFPY